MLRAHRPSPARKWWALTVALGVIIGVPIVSTATQQDAVPPTLKITAPAAGATLRGIVQVTGRAKDRGGVARVEVGIDGGSFSPATGTASWTFALDTALFADGAHIIVARGTDRDGNVGVVSVTVTVLNAPTPDTSPPTVWDRDTCRRYNIDRDGGGFWLRQRRPWDIWHGDPSGRGKLRRGLTVGDLVDHHRYHQVRRRDSHHRRTCPR